MRKKKIYRMCCAILLIVLICALYLNSQIFRPVQFVALNVGQGDSLYLHAPGNFDLLIDGGPDSTVLSRLSRHMPFYDRTIELVVLTHTDADHLFGLVDVAQRYRIAHFVWNGIPRKSATLDTLISLLQKQGTIIEVFKDPQRIVVNENLSIALVGPTASLRQSVQPVNEQSIIVRIAHGSHSVLTVGDAGFPAEQDLIADHVALRSEILKVGHHGSKTATSTNFLAAVNPRSAIISVAAKNRYGHPTAETLERLKNFGATIRRTDQVGDVIFNL